MKAFIKKLSLLFAVGAMAFGSNLLNNEAKVASAVETTVELKTFTATSYDMDSVVSYTTAKGGGTTDPSVNSNQIRLYQNSAGTGGGTITITAKSGTLDSVTIGSSMKTSIAHTIGSSTTKSATSSLDANGKHTVDTINDTSITFYCMGKDKNSRLYVNYLLVKYTLSGGTVDPEPEEPETPVIPDTPTTGEEVLLYSTGFESSEGFTATTSYNNTKIKNQGPTGKQWGVVFGTSSTTNPIADSQSMQMRYYTSENVTPYTQMMFDIENVSKITFYANNTAGNNVTLLYSSDEGTTFNSLKTYSLTTNGTEYSYSFDSVISKARFKFEFVAAASPTNKSRVSIDDVCIYGVKEETTATLTSISVDSTQTKTAFIVGETLKAEEIYLNGLYSDGKTRRIETGFTTNPALGTIFTETDISEAKIITVNYDGKSATFEVNVIEDTIKSLSLKNKTTQFKEGDLFTIGEGVNLIVNYSSGKIENIEFKDFVTKGVEVTFNGEIINLPYTLSLEDDKALVDMNYGGKSINAYLISVSEILDLTKGKYVKVTEELTDWSGTYLIVYENGSNAYVFNGVDSTKNYFEDEINDKFLIHANTDNSKYAVTIDAMENGYSILTSSGYISGTSGSNKLNFNSSVEQANTISFVNNHIEIISNTSALTFNDDSSDTGMRFRYYKSGSYSNMKSIQLYKYYSDNKYYEELKEDLLALNTCTSATDSTTINDEASIADFNSKLNNIKTRLKYITAEQLDDFKNTLVDEIGSYTLNDRLEFLERKASTLVAPKGISSNLLSNITSSNNILIILVVGLLGLTSILGYYFLNKKKYAR